MKEPAVADPVFTVVGSRVVCGVEPGGTLTEAQVLEAGGDVAHLIGAGHLSESKPTKKPAAGGEE